jgi:hypothetical protein
MFESIRIYALGYIARMSFTEFVCAYFLIAGALCLLVSGKLRSL